MPLDMERDDESEPYDEGDDGLNDVGDLSASVVQKVRSDTEIILLEAKIIEENTEFDTDTWIRLYGKKFRDIVTENPNLTKFQIKYLLYYR